MKKRYIALPILCILLLYSYFYYNHRKAAQQKEQNYVLVIDHRPKQLLQRQYNDLLANNKHTICTISDKEESVKMIGNECKHLSVEDITDYQQLVKAIQAAKLGKKKWVYIITADRKLEKSAAMLRDKYNVKKGVHPKAMRFFQEKVEERSPEIPSKNSVATKPNYSVGIILGGGVIKDWDIKAITMVNKEGMYYEVYQELTAQQASIKASLKEKTEALLQASGYQGNALHLRFDSDMTLIQHAFHSLFKKKESIRAALGLNFDKQQAEKRHQAYFVFYPTKPAEQETNKEETYMPIDVTAAHKVMKKQQHCSLHFSKITNGYRRGISVQDTQIDAEELLVYELLHKDRKQLEKNIQAIRDMPFPIKKAFIYPKQKQRVLAGSSWLGMLYSAIGEWSNDDEETTNQDIAEPSTKDQPLNAQLFLEKDENLTSSNSIKTAVVIIGFIIAAIHWQSTRAQTSL